MLWYFHSNVSFYVRAPYPGINGNGGGYPPIVSKSPVARRQFIFRNSKHPKNTVVTEMLTNPIFAPQKL